MINKKRFYYIMIILLVISTGMMFQCTKQDKHEHEAEGVQGEGAHDHEGETAESPDAHGSAETQPKQAGLEKCVQIKPEIIKKWGITYTSPVLRDYVEKIVLTGIIKEDTQKTYLINALVSGTVKEIRKDIGDSVQAGTILCVLNSPELLSLKTAYIKAFQEYRLNHENFRRSESLFKIKAIEQKELTARETTYKMALADFYSLEAQLSAIGFDAKTLTGVKDAVQQDNTVKLKGFLSPDYAVPAPAGGKVMNRDLSLGERVENNKTIFEISNTRKLWVLLDATEKDLRYIEKGKSLQVETDIYPGEIFKGKVLTLLEKIDPELRTLKVRGEVENEKGLLKPDMYIRGKIEQELSRKIPAIPASAIVKVSGVEGVFVYDGDEFIFKPVQVLEVDSAGFAYVNGIAGDVQVVHEGSFYLKAELEMTSGSVDPHAGHAH